jgi:hypothetical protein
MTAARLACLFAATFAATACSRASLELDPAIVPSCKAGYAEVVDVRWDAAASGTTRVTIDVLRPGTAAKQWTNGGPSGHKRTGKWGNDGLTFVLRADDGRELARRTIETRPCPKPD